MRRHRLSVNRRTFGRRRARRSACLPRSGPKAAETRLLEHRRAFAVGTIQGPQPGQPRLGGRIDEA